MRLRILLFLLCLICLGVALSAQQVEIFRRDLQFHGFASQGFIHTDENNWLTMNTSNIGSGAFTDFGLNASMQVTDRLRFGAQGYDRRLGQLGQWHPSLDWGFVDYRIKPWFGMRGGKVKTTLGLYNDTQDLDFLHAFALLPQSVYPTDIRDATIAHLGGDIYGNLPLKHSLGTLACTAYAGHRSDSIYSGYPYVLSSFGTHFSSFGGLQYGGDVRWSTPLTGLLIGVSRLDQDTSGKGTAQNLLNPAGPVIPYSEWSKSDWMNQYFGQYARGKLRIDSEYRRYIRDQLLFAGASENLNDVRGWYASGAYRVLKRLELGGYYSRYTITVTYQGQLAALGIPNLTNTSLPGNHIYDKVVAARIDLNKFWNLKVEGHFMNGYGNNTYPSGFYPQQNVMGLKPDTNALILKTSLAF